jgi:hypothetical protein
MRRKIEKFLARKQGVDETNIHYTEDGRFDFMGDLEGVLNAVRGRDSTGKKMSKADRSTAKKGSTAKKNQQEQKHEKIALDFEDKATDTCTTNILLPKLLRQIYTDEFDLTMNQVEDKEIELNEQQVVMIRKVVKDAFSNMRVETLEKISGLTDEKISSFILRK